MSDNNKAIIAYFKLIWSNQLMVILLLGLFFASYSCTTNLDSRDKLPKGIKGTYVAVFPFKNNTGQAELDVLGEIASDWITRGLIETKEGKIISAKRVTQIIAQANEQKIAPDNFISQEQDVHFLIEGSYYKVDSTLMFSSSIKNIESGEVVFSFPVIEGTTQEGVNLIEKLKQRILGYWVTKNLVDYKRKPPIYNAYKAYLEGNKIFYENPKEAGLLFEKAILLDSNFNLAKTSLASNFTNRNLYEKADSIKTFLEKIKNQMSPMELRELLRLEARITRNNNLLWRLNNAKDMPSYRGEVYWQWHKLQNLMHFFNQKEKALEFVNNIDFSKLDYKMSEAGYLYFWKAFAHYYVGEYKTATELFMNPPFELSFTHNNWALLIQFQVTVLAKMKAYNELGERLEYYYNTQPATVPYPKHYLRFFAIRSMFSADPKTAEIYAREYLRFLKDENKDLRTGWSGLTLQEITSELFLALGEPEKITSIIQKEAGLNNSRREILTLKGIYYAQIKNEENAREMITSLKEMGGKYDFGEYEYNSAIIEAWLGNKQLACSLLKDAQKKGKSSYYTNYQGDWRLQPLFDYSDFINNIPAIFPVPELDIPSEDKPKVAQNYWIYILGLIISGLAFYLFLRSHQQKRTKRLTSPMEEPETSLVEKEDAFLTMLKKAIEDNINDPNFSMPQLCKALGVSRAKIYRKVKSLTGKSPSVYIRSLKLQKAKYLLQTTDLNISEVAYEVGFNDLSYFSRSFSEEFGVSPSETRK